MGAPRHRFDLADAMTSSPFSSSLAKGGPPLGAAPASSSARDTLTQGEAGARAALGPHSPSPLAQREAMLGAVSFVARCFLSDGWEGKVEEALRRVGEALGVSRITVFEKVEPNAAVFSARYGWSAPDASPRPVYECACETEDLSSSPFAPWVKCLSSGRSVSHNVRDLPEATRLSLEKAGIVSIANVPIFVSGAWWGYLGIDDTGREHDWNEAQLETLRLCADLFGAGIARGRANWALEESETELLGLMSDVLFVFNREGVYQKVVTSNPAILVNPPEKILGHSLREVFDEATCAKFLGAIACALDTNAPARIEYSIQIQGREVRFDATVRPLDAHRVVWAARDITHAHRDAQALRESEQRFRLLAENSTDVITRLSPDLEVLYISPSIFHLTGYEPEELAGGDPLRMVHPDDVGRVRAAFARALEDPPLVETISYRLRHRDGRAIWCESAGNTIMDEAGGVEEIHLMTRDVSARRRGGAAKTNCEKPKRATAPSLKTPSKAFSKPRPKAATSPPTRLWRAFMDSIVPMNWSAPCRTSGANCMWTHANAANSSARCNRRGTFRISRRKSAAKTAASFGFRKTRAKCETATGICCFMKAPSKMSPFAKTRKTSCSTMPFTTV